jgi:predicted lipid carrier protein YhbT
VFVATAEECRQALESLTARILELSPEDRAAHLVDRQVSCHVTDLGVTFLTRLGPDGALPVREANGSDGRPQIRMSTRSDDLLALASDPGTFPRAWLTGRIKIEASLSDLLRLRKLL